MDQTGYPFETDKLSFAADFPTIPAERMGHPAIAEFGCPILRASEGWGIDDPILLRARDRDWSSHIRDSPTIASAMDGAPDTRHLTLDNRHPTPVSRLPKHRTRHRTSGRHAQNLPDGRFFVSTPEIACYNPVQLRSRERPPALLGLPNLHARARMNGRERARSSAAFREHDLTHPNPKVLLYAHRTC